ncbi:hypothetical protein C8R45DRAFT_837500 [Mycena sanguinolenta]|nr:hypothetical protein C8R45DRAFT_837500 [Mycena sanguinolenta]
MSISPPIRRMSVSSITRQEELINAYEAEEERIMNVLSKKLEQLREEKIELENVLEAESESHVNRLTRELTSLRLELAGLDASSPVGPSNPSMEIMLAALQRENEALRSRLVAMERDYVRVSRLNEVFREELLDHRNRLGLPVDHLIGLGSSDPYSQLTHQRPQSTYSSTASSPTNSVLHAPISHPTNGVPIPRPAAQANGVPIPRPPTQLRRANNNISEGNTPLSHSPSSSSDSPFPFSPVTSPNPAGSYVSVSSIVTSPPTSYNPGGVTFGAPSRGLSYPSVPPPSLSSSFGSPTVSYHMHMPQRDHSLSPVEPQSRRNSIRRGARIAESGSLHRSSSQSRRTSVERGARVAETGQLVPRSHPDGHTLSATTEAPDSPRILGGIDIPPNGSSYPDEYGSHSAPPTPRASDYQPQQWDQQPQDSQLSQTSDQLSQHMLEQALDQSQPQSQSQDYPQIPPPPPQQPLYQQQPHHQLEEPQRLVPSQIPARGTHDNTPIRLLPPGTPARSPPVEIQPVMLKVDTTLRATAHAGPSTRPASRARPHQYHPYPRPTSASGSSAAAHRRELEAHHHVRFASQGSTPQGSAQHSPAAGRQTFASPMSDPSGQQQSTATSPAFVSSEAQNIPPARATDARRYFIRTDTHYDPGTRVLTAMLELPGLRKNDLTITLATTLFNRVRQVTVNGHSRPPFAPSSSTSAAPVLRERRYGRFTRSFSVPADTKVRRVHFRVMSDPSFVCQRMPPSLLQPEDIDAAMEDGVLVLKISCGVPAASADEHEIPIR